jgi:Flp pilus assembly protein TadG
VVALLQQPMKRVRGDEQGIAMVVSGLVLVTLMVVAAIVVDLGNARQEKTNLQSAVDAGALSAGKVLYGTAGTQDVYTVAADGVFKSLGLSNTVTVTNESAGCTAANECVFSTVANGQTLTVTVTEDYQGNPTWVNVNACWAVINAFGPVIHSNTTPFCAHATAKAGMASPGGQNGGCGASTELPAASDVPQPGKFVTSGGFIQPQTVSATYTPPDTNSPLDATRIYFWVQNQYGYMQPLSYDGTTDGSGGGYGLNPQPPSGGNYDVPATSVKISYQIPIAVTTFSGEVGVADQTGKDCGNTSWSTCDAKGDNIFESYPVKDTDGDSVEDPAAEGDENITPATGSVVTLGQTVSGDYGDETIINPTAIQFIINGTLLGSYDGTTDGSAGGPNYGLSTVPSQNHWQDVDPNVSWVEEGSAGGTAGTVDVAVATFNNIAGKNPATVPVHPKSPTGQAYVAGQPVAGVPITVTATLADGSPANTTGGNVKTGITNADGTLDITFADSTKEAVIFTATYGVAVGGPAKALGTSGTIVDQFGYGFNGATAPTGLGEPTNAVNWTFTNTSENPETIAFTQQASQTGPLVSGWNDVFLYVKDSDQNKAGGDCALVNWSFPATGFPGGNGALNLIR